MSASRASSVASSAASSGLERLPHIRGSAGAAVAKAMAAREWHQQQCERCGQEMRVRMGHTVRFCWDCEDDRTVASRSRSRSPARAERSSSPPGRRTFRCGACDGLYRLQCAHATLCRSCLVDAGLLTTRSRAPCEHQANRRISASWARGLVHLQVGCCYFIDSVKELIYTRTGLHGELRLTFGGTVLQGDQSIVDYNIPQGSVLQITRPIQLKIVASTGVDMMLEVDALASVSSLKDQVAAILNVEPGQLMPCHDFTQLREDLQLEHAVAAGDTVQMVLLDS